ncbi:Molybdopterin synthase sulfur carrier subunit [Lachnellula occidentalis]|uniref:Molybdopterin synthase sulfur carrier subunit n=1 Tax=Lachnellula occidentalis TaxID=215460 RepID=A0A8H8RKL8_9HELO|nr:Molybdopterin synthase sulfur carrier subunit [Lachnellula occidentalis]
MSALKAPAGHFTILYFASASSYTAKNNESFPAPLPLSKLFEMLEEKYNGMKDKVLMSCLVTVNLEYVDIPEDCASEPFIKEGDEVAIIPPVSSGPWRPTSPQNISPWPHHLLPPMSLADASFIANW